MAPGDVLREAWRTYKTHWRHLLPIALVVYLLLSLFTLLLAALLGFLGAIAGAFVSLAGVFWLQGAMVVAIEDVRDGRGDLSIRETLSRVRPRMNTLALAGIVAALAITAVPVLVGVLAAATGAALLLLLAPALVVALLLMTWWLVIVPVIMLEGAGVFAAFGRSRELVSGHGWSAFGLIVLTFLILLVAGIVLGIVLAPLPDGIQGYVQSVVSNTVAAPFVALAFTLSYYRLRGTREAVTPAATSV